MSLTHWMGFMHAQRGTQTYLSHHRPRHLLISRSVLTLVSNQPAYFPKHVLARASQPTWSSTVMQSHLLLSLLPHSHLLLTLQVYRERRRCALTSASQSLIKTGTTAARCRAWAAQERLSSSWAISWSLP